MQPSKFFPFAEYLPDIPPLRSPGSPNINNVIPFIDGAYLPAKELSAITDALNSACRGAYTVRHTDAITYTYAGTATKLYEISGPNSTVTDRSSAAYSLQGDNYWKFAKYGGKVIATNFVDVPEIVTIGAGANFANLGGSPPKARHIAVVKEQVVLANLDEGGVLTPDKLSWSGVNNEATWAQSATTLADSQTLKSSAKYGGGWIQEVLGGEFGIIFQEFSIWRMTFIGSPFVFQFDEVLPGYGTPAPNSVVQYGNVAFYLGQEGFDMLINGVERVPIGYNKIDSTFLNDLKSEYLYNVVGAVDPANRVVYWIYPGAGSSSGVPNKMICYNWFTKRWAPIDVDAQWIFSSAGQGYTLEELDNVNASLDALPASLDSRRWSEGALQIAAFNTSHKYSTFTGSTKAAVMETAEFEAYPGRRSLITGIRPIQNGGAATVKMKHRTLQTDTETTGSSITPSTVDGIAHVRSNNRYQRAQITTSGDFTHAMGVDVFAKPAGRR